MEKKRLARITQIERLLARKTILTEYNHTEVKGKRMYVVKFKDDGTFESIGEQTIDGTYRVVARPADLKYPVFESAAKEAAAKRNALVSELENLKGITSTSMLAFINEYGITDFDATIQAAYENSNEEKSPSSFAETNDIVEYLKDNKSFNTKVGRFIEDEYHAREIDGLSKWMQSITDGSTPNKKKIEVLLRVLKRERRLVYKTTEELTTALTDIKNRNEISAELQHITQELRTQAIRNLHLKEEQKKQPKGKKDPVNA